MASRGYEVVLDSILIFVFSLIPPLLSLLLMRKAEIKARDGLRSAMHPTAVTSLQNNHIPSEQHYVEGIGYLIGDNNCIYNAHSPYIRCGVNPFGPCKECPHFQPREVKSTDVDSVALR